MIITGTVSSFKSNGKTVVGIDHRIRSVCELPDVDGWQVLPFADAFDCPPLAPVQVR